MRTDKPARRGGAGEASVAPIDEALTICKFGASIGQKTASVGAYRAAPAVVLAPAGGQEAGPTE